MGQPSLGFVVNSSRPRETTRFHYADMLLNFPNSGHLRVTSLPEDH